MITRKLLILSVLGLLFLGLAGVGVSEGQEEDVKGTVIKIEGGKVTVKDMFGAEKTVEPKNPEVIAEIRLGDRVAVKYGILTKEGGMGPAAPPTGSGY